jgi:excisionase family DNA binding protein
LLRPRQQIEARDITAAWQSHHRACGAVDANPFEALEIQPELGDGHCRFTAPCGFAVSGPAGPNAAAAGTEPSGPPFRSLREAAGWLCVSLPTLKPTIAKRDLRTVRVGKHRKVPASYLAAYVAKDILLLNQVVDFTQDCSIAFEYSDSE